MPPTPQKRQPRLKESCDRCSLAKVRCNKDKPSCSRCHLKGLACSYSYSRRAGRRTPGSAHLPVVRESSCSSTVDLDDAPSLTSSSLSPDLSPGDLDDKADLIDEWSSFPQMQHHGPIPPQPGDVFNNDLFHAQNGTLGQTFPLSMGQNLLGIPQLDPTVSLMDAVLPPPGLVNVAPFDDAYVPGFMPPQPLPPTASMAPSMQRTSTSSTSTMLSDCSTVGTATTVSSHQADAVRDELADLSDFADVMERKFDAVVRTRMQYRDMYSETGVPVDDFENSNGVSDGMLGDEDMSVLSGAVMPKGGANGKGPVPTPDLSELSMYYSLAELKRRLKWLRQDVGNMMRIPGQPC